MYMRFTCEFYPQIKQRNAYADKINLYISDSGCASFVIELGSTELVNDGPSVADARARILAGLLSISEGRFIEYKLKIDESNDRLITIIINDLQTQIFDNRGFISKILTYMWNAYHAKENNCWVSLYEHITNIASILPSGRICDEIVDNLPIIMRALPEQNEISERLLELIRKYTVQILKEKSVLTFQE